MPPTPRRHVTSPTRRRDAQATPKAILAAALRCFAEADYSAVGVRRIAALAGVDAALINRYFGSKEELLIRVIREYGPHHSLWSLASGEKSTLGQTLVNHLLYPPSDDTRDYLRVIRRNSVSGMPAIIQEMHEKFVTNLADNLTGDHTYLRARLIDAILVGVATVTLLQPGEPIPQEYLQPFAEELARAVQRHIDGLSA